MRVVILILLIVTAALGQHNPAIPDTIFISTLGNNRDGFLAGRNAGNFLTLRGLGTGTATISNSSSAAERGLTWHSSVASTDTLNRYFWYGEALGSGGTFKSSLTNLHRADSSFWSTKYEGEIDSSYCVDSVFVLPCYKQNSNPGQILAAHFNDPYTGSTDGFDTTAGNYVQFKRLSGTNRAKVKLPTRFTDSLYSWINNTSSTALAPKIAMVGASDFRIDSLNVNSNAPSTSNTLEACSFFFSEQTDINDRPYILYFWTDTTPSGLDNGWQRWGNAWNSWLTARELINPFREW